MSLEHQQGDDGSVQNGDIGAKQSKKDKVGVAIRK